MNKKETMTLIEDHFRKRFQIPSHKKTEDFTISGLTFEEYSKDMINFFSLGVQSAIEQFSKNLDKVIFEAEKSPSKNIVH